MIHVNLIRESPVRPIKLHQQVLCKTQFAWGSTNVPFPFLVSNSTVPGTLPWPKAPLRVVAARVPYVEYLSDSTAKVYAYLETLECGHQNWVYPQFIWDDGHLQEMAPSAKRRRCMDCMPAVARKSAASERRAA